MNKWPNLAYISAFKGFVLIKPLKVLIKMRTKQQIFAKKLFKTKKSQKLLCECQNFPSSCIAKKTHFFKKKLQFLLTYSHYYRTKLTKLISLKHKKLHKCNDYYRICYCTASSFFSYFSSRSPTFFCTALSFHWLRFAHV